MDHARYLLIALQEARKAAALGSFPVGAVLVDEFGVIVDTAHNTAYSGKRYLYHAEMVLIIRNQAYLWKNPSRSILYTSLEPCVMCMGTAIMNRIPSFAWALNDLWAGATRSYDFNSAYLMERVHSVVPVPSETYERESAKLVLEWLEQNSPEFIPLILGHRSNCVGRSQEGTDNIS